MKGIFVCVFFTILHFSSSQNPPRLQIPGALLVQGGRPLPRDPLRQQRLNALSLNPEYLPRTRRPLPPPLREIRPVVEEEEDIPPSAIPTGSSSFDAEVNKFSLPAISSAIKQAEEEDELQQTARPSPLPFRPEKPVPITRDQVRDQRPLPVLRQELRQQRPAARPVRPVVRQEIDFEEEENIPRQPIRQKPRPQQVFAQQYRPAQRPKGAQAEEDELNRKRKPVVQILRKYRTDNEDGSITWGFENEDGTFKEETLGTDCVIKGKYGYVDPDGVKREFVYEAGNKCDPNQQEELDDDELPPGPPPRLSPKKPAGKQNIPQAQYRPSQLSQYPILHFSSSQNPPRLQIPGALLVQGGRPLPRDPLRQQRLNALSLNPEYLPRTRRPLPPPLREIRPVVEEEEDIPPSAIPTGSSSFDAEVNKFSLPAISSAIKQAEEEDELQQTARPSPLPFRPEKPVPITRDQVRDQRPLPVLRQELRQQRPAARPVRPVVTQEIDFEEEENIPRQPIRQKPRPQQVFAQQYRPAQRPKGAQAEEDELNRKRKPVVQILRKYRTDNEDGSITWGFENEDGTFKEETLGTDCVIKGKYGYVDPDGVKREFVYEAGNKCDPNQQEELDDDELPPGPPPRLSPKKPAGKQNIPQAQYRPSQLSQYP